MRRFSAFAVAKEAMRSHKGWEKQWDNPEPKSILGFRVVFRPESNKLVKMVRTKNRPITSEVVKIVHDDGHEQVYNLQ